MKIRLSLFSLFFRIGWALSLAFVSLAASADIIYSGQFSRGDGLVTKTNQLSTNHLEPSEGSLAALLDANFGTFFHSTWSQDNTDGDYAWLQADLGVELSAFVMKYAKRSLSNNGHPTTVHVYATNHPDGTWTDQGRITCSYPYTSTPGANYTGVSMINFDGDYRYVRLVVEATEGGGVSRGNLYFYWSEWRAYEVKDAPPVSRDLSRLCINEIQTSNLDMFVDASCNYGGWMELYNPTDSAVVADEFYLSDDPDDPKKYKMIYPVTIPAHGYGVVGFDHADGAMACHAPFKLNADGGILCLADRQGRIVLQEMYPAAVSRTSWARMSDGAPQWGLTAQPTRETSNNRSAFASERLEAPAVSRESGMYQTAFSFTVEVPDGCTLCYTDDGSTPTLEGGKRSTDGRFSVKDQTRVYRFRLFRDGYLPSPVVTRSFIYTDRKYTVPAVSLVTDDRFLHDDSIGVMVRGTNGMSGLGQSSPCNWNMDWERAVNVEYILPDGDVPVNQEVLLSICGGWSRASEPHSFKLRASNTCEQTPFFDYGFFSAKPHLRHKTLQFRAGGNDNGCRITDAALQTIIQSSGLEVDGLSYQPVVHFHNGVYKGVINLREPSNKHFVRANFGLEEDEIDQFKIGSGSGTKIQSYGYNQLCGTKEALDSLRELTARCADDAVYEEVRQLLDVDEYINYMATEIYLGTTDWLNNTNNTKGWRPREAGGRFRLVQFDLDSSFGTTSAFDYFKSFRNITNVDTGRGEEFDWVNIFIELCANARFRRQFIDTFCLVCGSVFDHDRVATIVDSLTANVRPMMAFEGRSPDGSANNIKNQCTTGRATTMVSQMRRYTPLHMDGMVSQKVTLASSHPSVRLFVNDTPVPTNRFSGVLFGPVVLRAEVPEGMRFAGWYSTHPGEENTLLSSGSSWRYWDRGSLDGTDWYKRAYSDQSWSQGSAPLGYANKDLGIQTTLSYGPSSSDKYPTCYLRTTVVVPEGNVENIRLDYRCDDGFILYVDGREAARYNMPAGEVGFSTYTPTYSGDWFEGSLALDASLFTKGRHQLAVEVHNCSGTSSDLFWDAALTAVMAPDANEEDLQSTTPVWTLPEGATLDVMAVVEPEETEDAERLPIRINELCASKGKYVSDWFEYADWIELVNATDKSVDVAGMYLQSGMDEADAWCIPSGDISTLIAPRGHLIIWCDRHEGLTELHAPLRLPADSGVVVLTDADRQWADTLAYRAHGPRESVGLYPDAGSTRCVFSRPTIGSMNLYSTYTDAYDERALRATLTEAYIAADVEQTMEHDTTSPAFIYDLQGRPHEAARLLTPGIYIQNGKKILVR